MQTGYTSYNGRSLQAIFQLKGDLGFITPGLSVNGAVGFNTYLSHIQRNHVNMLAIQLIVIMPMKLFIRPMVRILL